MVRQFLLKGCGLSRSGEAIFRYGTRLVRFGFRWLIVNFVEGVEPLPYLMITIIKWERGLSRSGKAIFETSVPARWVLKTPRFFLYPRFVYVQSALQSRTQSSHTQSF